MTQHPITPPPELVQQLCDKAILHAVDGARRGEIEVWLIQEAFRVGADQELEACCEWVKSKQTYWAHDELRAARRPKPPSLKKQALEQLDGIAAVFRMSHGGDLVCDTIRRAIEALPE
jgi:hypothetical protein